MSPSKQLLGLFLSTQRVNWPSSRSQIVAWCQIICTNRPCCWQGAVQSRRDWVQFMFVRGLQGCRGDQPFCQHAVTALGKTVLFLVLPWQVLTRGWVIYLPQFVTSQSFPEFKGLFLSLSVGDLNGERSVVLLQVLCQAPNKQQRVPLVHIMSCLQGLPTLLFIVSIPVTASPSCTFSKLSNLPHLQHCKQKLQIYPQRGYMSR